MTRYSADTKVRLLLAILVAIAVLLRFGEAMFTMPTQLAGAKPGLTNCITIICLYSFGLRLSSLYLFTRILLTGLLITGLFTPTFFIGGAGAVASLFTMHYAIKLKIFSPPGVGIIGAATHNMMQLLTASVLMNTTAVLDYWPLLLLLSIPFGLFTGYIAQVLLPRLQHFLKGFVNKA